MRLARVRDTVGGKRKQQDASAPVAALDDNHMTEPACMLRTAMTEPGRNPNRSGVPMFPNEGAEHYGTRAQNVLDAIKCRRLWWDEQNYSVYRIRAQGLTHRTPEWIWDAITYKIESTWM